MKLLQMKLKHILHNKKRAGLSNIDFSILIESHYYEPITNINPKNTSFILLCFQLMNESL